MVVLSVASRRIACKISTCNVSKCITLGLRAKRTPVIIKVRASGDDNGSDDLDRQLREDMESLRQRQSPPSPSSSNSSFSPQQGSRSFQSISSPSSSSSSSAAAASESPLTGLKNAVDNLLIADFFFILFALAWLGVGLAVNSAFHSSALLDTWLGLWQWVFQPAIGVLMLGAIAGGVVNWAKENLGGGNK